MEQLNAIPEWLRPVHLDKLQGLAFFEEKYKVKPSVVGLGVFLGLLILSPLLHTHSLLTSVVCYLVPGYLSFLALESKDKDDDIRYLNYWIIFSVAEVFTPFLRIVFSKFFYMLVRITITIVLLHPMSDLSLKIYNTVVRPFLAKHESTIDENLEKFAEEGKKKIIEGVKEGLDHM